jgi:hypothetical protein
MVADKYGDRTYRRGCIFSNRAIGNIASEYYPAFPYNAMEVNRFPKSTVYVGFHIF